jgi:hypothetical protein
MDLAQKANRVKRELQAAAHKPEETSIRHAVEAFDAFVDGVVEEIGQLKTALKNGATDSDNASPELEESVVSESPTPDVAATTKTRTKARKGKAAEPELERQAS